jgi:hypothetical protein
MMHGHEKSDSVIVAVKPANKAEDSTAERSAAEQNAAESVERRAGGECGPAKHALDAAPGSRVTGAGPHTESRCRHIPEVRAVCGKAARTVLCGGRAMKSASLPLQRRPFILANLSLMFRTYLKIARRSRSAINVG